MRLLFLEVDTESAWAVASIGPAFLASYLRREGHEVAFLRARIDMDGDAVAERVRALAPDVIGLSLTSRQWLRARTLVRRIREDLDVPVVAGGLHPTFAADDVLASPGFDFACLGEGEEALRDLLACLAAGRRPGPGEIANIQVRPGEPPPLRPPLPSLDDLPFPARDMLDEQHGVAHVTTQRGCPFPCTYCAARKYGDLYEPVGEYGRRRSHGHVLAELRLLRDGGAQYVIFLDDTFTIHHPWVKEFCALYRAECGLPFSIHARVETVSEALVQLLAQAGCRHVVYGVESGSPRVRREIMRRPVSNERFEQVFAWTRQAGILVTANYMLGLPGETKEDVEQTLALHERLQPDDFGYFVFYPYPGTELYRTCVERGYLPENHLDLPASHRRTILRLPDLSPEDVERFYDRFTAARESSFLRRYGLGTSPESREAIAADARRTAATG